VRIGFACPFLYADAEVTVSHMAAQMHVAWKHPWVGVYCPIRFPHLKACESILESSLRNPNLDMLFWTEDDCVLPVDAVTRLMNLLIEHPEADVATGITFMRRPPHHPMIADFGGTLTEEILRGDRPVMDFENPDKMPEVGKDHYRFITRIDTSQEPFRVDAASMNCLLFRRRALVKLRDSDPHPFDPIENGATTPDFAMFDRLRRLGNVLMVDPALLTHHLGDREHIGFEQWVREMDARVARNAAEEIGERVVGKP
jgi:hypothetical protein